jgi:hypothetical protein
MALVAVASLFCAAALGFVGGIGGNLIPAGAQIGAGEYLEGSAIPPSKSRDSSVKEITSADLSPDITVTLVIEAGNEYNLDKGRFWVSFDVPLARASQVYTVTDLLYEANGTHGFTFYGPNMAQFTQTTNYVQGVEYNDGTDDITWEAGQMGYDGWVFRLNDKFPVFTDGTGWTGASILQTNIGDGDIVHLFYDFYADIDSDSGIFAANYVSGVYVEPEENETNPTVQLHGHTTFIFPSSANPPMYVDNYKDIQGGITAYLYDSTGTTLYDTKTSDLNGRVTFDGRFSGDYIVKTDPVYRPAYSAVEIANNTYIALTGAYFKVSFP